MSRFTCRAIILFYIILKVSMATADDPGNKFLPKPVPVNLKPPSYDENYMGVGYNQITAISEWNDSWLTGDEEEVGALKYTVKNLVVGIVKSKGSETTMELDFIIGKVEFEEDTTSFFYESLPGGGQDMDVEASGDGYDIGFRYVKSKTFFRQNRIDWNYALSLHAAYFYTDGSYEALSDDNQYGESYDEEEWGIFLRPVVSLQPLVSISNSISFVPYIGLASTITLSEYYWENTEYISGGESMPSQFSEGSDFYFNTSGVEALIGFDVGIITSHSKKHKLTIGGAISELMGDEESSFQELHVLYAIPTDFNIF